MKICPSCRSTYTDESLRFCLQDGTDLVSSNARGYQTHEFVEQETVARKDPITSEWAKSRETMIAPSRQQAKSSNPLLIAVLTAAGMCILFGGMVAAWFLISSSGSNSGTVAINSNYGTPAVLPTIAANSNSVVSGTAEWQPIDFNASLNGERLTFYRGTTAEQCQADCHRDPKCRGFGLVRAGAYNPEDPPMCYLLSKVTSSTPSSCCISGIKK
ncbi:MAG: hypothetical protein IPM25_04255 [Chloracidobacterium sp.]|nr:hypothetical protein [Chloracidobacterium sp.]